MSAEDNKVCGRGTPTDMIWRKEVMEVAKVNNETIKNRAKELLIFLINE